ncbi:MAG TPA: type VI secretion system tip protein TssI/VgrG [Polyangiaceae bacterium]|nr:type VI secretion system tip protein TssI/VgrG [Polyangiaceae bacterium]
MSHLSLAFDERRKGGGAKQAEGPLDVRRFSVNDALSEPFFIHLLALSPSAELRPRDFVGRDVTFRIDTGAQGVRAWHGVVLSFEQSDVEEKGLSTYELTIGPRLALLDHRVNCRVFQRQSAPEIAEEILAEWHIDVERRLSEEHRRLEYRVQYNESDLDFMARVLGEAGISYFFEGEGGDARLVLCDRPQQADATRPPLPYKSSDHEDTDEPHVRFIVGRKEVRPAAVTIADFDFRRPRHGIFHSAEGGGGARSDVALEQTIYRPGSGLASSPGGSGATETPVADALSTARVDEQHGQSMARAALESQRGLELELQSNVSWLAPGTAFFVSDHARLDKKRLLVTRSRLLGDSAGSFSAVAVARHTSSAVRPAMAARPVMPGVQSAVVVGPPGEEVHVDELGRVRVHFHWNRRGSFDEKSTCWVRVAEGWGGAGFGMVSLPRIGNEVLVEFFAGNPDEPIIVGRVHGGATPPAFDSGKGSMTGWRTRSTPDGDGFHEISFEDEAGRELFFIRSERDLRSAVQNEEHESVGRDHIARIGEDLTTSVAGNDSVTAAASSIAMGKVEGLENIKEMGAPSIASSMTLREMVPGRITLTTGGTMVQLIDDEIFVVADGNLKINGKLVDIHGGPFVHVNPPAQAKVQETEEDEKEGHVVWFQLKDKNKKPIPNLECFVESEDGLASYLQKTDGQGRVLFNVGNPGAYSLVVAKKAEAPASKSAVAKKADPEPEGDGPVAKLSAAAPQATAAAKKPSVKDNKKLRLNKAGLALIKKSEGFRSKPYVDPVGIPTIGYGTIKYPNGRAVRMSDPPISEARATKYLKRDARSRELAVIAMVKVPLNVNQFSALVSFAYNVGLGALQGSTLLKKLNAGKYNGAASEFMKWNKGTIGGKLVVLPGLTIRRAAERKLFKKPVKTKPKKPPESVPASPTGGVEAPSAKAQSTPVKVGSTAAKPVKQAKMTKHTVPLETLVAWPKGSEKLTIKAGTHPGKGPSMPRIKLKASATLDGEPISEGTFRWQLWIGGQYKTRMGTKKYHLLAGDARTEPGETVKFKLAPPAVVGGNLMVKVQFEHPKLGTVQMKTIKGIKVGGKNPTKAHIESLINDMEPELGWLISPLIAQESAYRQFRTPSKVLVGKPASIGLSQLAPVAWGSEKLDPGEPNAFFPRIYWDWKENVRAGVKFWRAREGVARRHLDKLQAKHGLSPYSKGMLARETLRRYFGGVEFSAEDGQWKVAPRAKGKAPAPANGQVDQLLARIDPADIPEEYADITTTQFS